jgi:hypothetical protein
MRIGSSSPMPWMYAGATHWLGLTLDFIIQNLAEIEPGRAIIGLLANQKRTFVIKECHPELDSNRL